MTPRARKGSFTSRMVPEMSVVPDQSENYHNAEGILIIFLGEDIFMNYFGLLIYHYPSIADWYSDINLDFIEKN